MMKHKYTWFLFFLIHISINAIPECYVSFDQSKQHQIHPANAWPAQQYKHHKYYGVSYKTAASLRNYSKSDLQLYFDARGYSEKDILSYDVLYMSDEFIELAKTYSDYEDALKKLHKKLSRMSAVQRMMGCIHSTYYPNLLKRVRHLYKELHQYQRVATEAAKSFAQLYDINLLALFPYSDSLISRNIYKNYIHILDQASNVSLRNGIMRDWSSIGLEANKHGYTQYAFQLADFCFTMLDCAIAFDEGIYLGALQAVDAITHPVETIKNNLIGIGVIALGLSKLISVPIECAFLYATDRDCFHIKTNAMWTQLITVAQHAMRYIQATPPRDIVKQSSAFVSESVLLARIGTFAHNVSKKLLPIARSYFEYVIKKDPLVCLADGATIAINIPKKLNIPYTIESKIVQKLKPLGRGNTGRSTPNNVCEQLVLEEIMADPYLGFPIKINKGMTDKRWPKSEGWVKKGWRSNGIEVHFVAQEIDNVIVAIDDFKFKLNE